MEATSAGLEAHTILTTEEEIYCHKARIFSVLTKAPVVRAWKNAICDGAVYLGKGRFPTSYADRYFKISSDDISYVTFSIVTAFKEIGVDAEGQEIERSQCHISLAQRELSEFLIVTFSDDHDRIALLPNREYYYESSRSDMILPEEISASTLSTYSFSIDCLLASIEEVRRITVNPMHPTTTPFQIGLDGIIPKSSVPIHIMPGPSEAEELHEEKTLRTVHKILQFWPSNMKLDFLEYQPLLRDFKIVICKCESFPDGLEAVISYNSGPSKNSDDSGNNDHLEYADYLFTHGITFTPDCAFFIPRRLIGEAWFTTPRPKESMPTELRDSGRRVSNKDFMFQMDDAGRWILDVWKIINKYPPGDHPTLAEERQEMFKKAIPWPELEAQVALQKASTPQNARGDLVEGDDIAVKSSDVSLLAAHYLEKASLSDDKAGEDAA